MAIPLTLEQFNNLADEILNEVFFAGYERTMDQGMSVVPVFGTRNPGNSRYAYGQSLGGVGFFEKREEGGPVNKDEVEQLFKTTFTMEHYNKVIPIDYTMVADQNYLGINDLVTALGIGAGKTRRNHAASIFNNAFSDSYLGGDGEPLCETNHGLNAAKSSTQGNKGTTALSYDAVAATMKEMMLFKDARGKPAPSIPDTLIVPVALWETASQIAENVNEPDTADRNINAVKKRGGLRFIADPYLDISDSNNWFLVDSVLAQQHLLWYDREPLTFGVDLPTQTDKNYYAGADMRYDFGWVDWRWVYGHEVA